MLRIATLADQEAAEAEGQLKDEYGMEYGITGTTAIYADVDDVLLGSIVPYMAIVAGAAFILLILVFRSILVPLLGALGFLLSMGATFGATVLIFQEGAFGLADAAVGLADTDRHLVGQPAGIVIL